MAGNDSAAELVSLVGASTWNGLALASLTQYRDTLVSSGAGSSTALFDGVKSGADASQGSLSFLQTLSAPFIVTLKGGKVLAADGQLAGTPSVLFDAVALVFSAEGCAEVERLSAGSLKRTWVGGAKGRDWYSTAQSGGRAVLAHASQVKNVWIPYGV